MMKGVERRGVSRREGQCVLDVRCVCASHESGLQVNLGGRCSRQSWGLYHQTRYWLETTVWYQAPDHGCQWSSFCSFLFLLLFPSPTPFSRVMQDFFFFYLFIFFDSDRLRTNTNWAKGPSSHACLFLTVSHTHIHTIYCSFNYFQGCYINRHWLEAKWTAQ